MWVKLLCVLVVLDVLGAVAALRIFEAEKHGQEKSADLERSASMLIRVPGLPELQHSFGVKIEHPSGEDVRGRLVEQREHHAFGDQPRVEQHEFQPSQVNPASVGGEWKGISRFREHQDQESLGHDLSQHQVLGQVLQGLGQVNQILGKTHQGVEQVNQIFGQGHQDYHKQNSFTNGEREVATLEMEKKQEDHKSNVAADQEVIFEQLIGDVSKYLVDDKENTNYDFKSEFKPLVESSSSVAPQPLGQVQVNSHDVKAITVTKEVAVPYPVQVEKKVPFKVEVPVDKPYPVEHPKPYPVYVEKKVPYKVKEYVPQPYTVYKRVPYPVKVHLSKPYPVQVPKPYRVLVEKKVPYTVQKRVPYPVRVFVDKSYPVHVPVFRPVPYSVDTKVPLPVQVPVEKLHPVTVPKPYKVYLEKKVPYAVHAPMYHQQEGLSQHRFEGSGQPGTTQDQSTTHELQTHHQHPQWRGYVPHPVQVPTYYLHSEGSRQPGTTDHGTSSELQGYHQHPPWKENVPTYHPQELGLQDAEGSRHSGASNQGSTFEHQRHHRHPQWKENVPVSNPYDLSQQGVDGSRQGGTTDQGVTSELQRYEYHQHPLWKEHSPYPVQEPPPSHHRHDLGQQAAQESGHPAVTTGADQRHALLEGLRHNPSQWTEHAPRYS